jgi:hypothetical protein
MNSLNIDTDGEVKIVSLNVANLAIGSTNQPYLMDAPKNINHMEFSLHPLKP